MRVDDLHEPVLDGGRCRWPRSASKRDASVRGYSPTDDAMTVIAVNPAELLFSNAEGKPTSLEDLIDDGSTARIAVAFPR